MKVRVLARALAELDAFVARIRRDRPRAAAEFAEAVFAVIEQLAAGDFDGPESTLRTGARVRSWPVPPMRLYYQRRADELVVMRIHHQARRPISR